MAQEAVLEFQNFGPFGVNDCIDRSIESEQFDDARSCRPVEKAVSCGAELHHKLS